MVCMQWQMQFIDTHIRSVGRPAVSHSLDMPLPLPSPPLALLSTILMFKQLNPIERIRYDHENSNSDINVNEKCQMEIQMKMLM